MESCAASKITLVDLLDRVLDRGLVIDADVVVTMAGVPLLAVKLRAALAGMETMLAYGMMKDWDMGIRAQADAPRGTSDFPAHAPELLARRG